MAELWGSLQFLYNFSVQLIVGRISYILFLYGCIGGGILLLAILPLIRILSRKINSMPSVPILFLKCTSSLASQGAPQAYDFSPLKYW